MRTCFVDNMASFGLISRMAAVKTNEPDSLRSPRSEHVTGSPNSDDAGILCGTQLSPKCTFHSKKTTINALPIIVDFRRLLMVDNKNAVEVVPGVSRHIVQNGRITLSCAS